MDIYGIYREPLEKIMRDLADRIGSTALSAEGEKLYDHISFRIKSDVSVREKLEKRGLEATAVNALRNIRDSIGIRVVCLFLDDVYECVRLIKTIPGLQLLEEKDYIYDAKPNGYRSYHMILDVTGDAADVDGQTPGHFFAEIQLRTIAMDTWAALEHELKYKKDIADQEMIVRELHRCANDLAACDVSMQTLRRLIRDM